MKFYNEILDKLKNRVPFKFSRWGDGEWLCMQGEEGKNRDGNTYLPELGKELIRILESRPDYYIGIQYGVFYNEILREFMMQYLFRLNIDWVYGDTLHVASEFGYLGQFIEALKGRTVIIIGAEYFREIPWCGHIIIPGYDSFKDNEEIYKQVEMYRVSGYADDVVYLVAAAMNSNVIIDWIPDSVTAIDIGSVLDPYLGRPRASYQHNMNFQKLW